MSVDDMATAGRPRTVRLSGPQIRKLAHPLRARLLGALRLDGPATATTLARALDTNTGATSYHLRQLADVGLVLENAGQGEGRRRFWRAAHEASTWAPTDFDDDPDARAASDWIQDHQLRVLAELGEQWLSRQHEAAPAWREAADFSDAVLTLSPARLRALNDEIWQLITRYRRDETLAGEDGAEQVLLFLAGFPRGQAKR
jgi:DNA-binding transcriptional ArsR family regulator